MGDTWEGSPSTSGARAALAGPGEVLVSSTVGASWRAPASTSAIGACGALERGVPGEWRLFATTDTEGR